MQNYSEEEIWQRVGQITTTYPLLECDRCAIAVARWLEHWDIPYQILRIKTKRRSDSFIVSRRYGNTESVTENGTHYGVEVVGKVFDNLSAEGLPREEWIQDFRCLSGRLILDEVPLSWLLGRRKEEEQ